MRQYERLSTSLRSVHGSDVVRFVSQAAILDAGAETAADVVALLARETNGGSAHHAELVREDGDELLVRRHRGAHRVHPHAAAAARAV